MKAYIDRFEGDVVVICPIVLKENGLPDVWVDQEPIDAIFEDYALSPDNEGEYGDVSFAESTIWREGWEFQIVVDWKEDKELTQKVIDDHYARLKRMEADGLLKNSSVVYPQNS